MRIASIYIDDHIKLAVVDGEEAWPVETLNGFISEGEAIPTYSLAFIERFSEHAHVVDKALKLAREKGDAGAVLLSEARFAPPVPEARKLLCVAGNYVEHIVEGGGKAPGEDDILPPRVFMKPPSTTMIGSGEAVILSKNSVSVDWELELGVVIGKRARHVSPEQARDVIFGYTIVNDISERDFDPGPRNKERDGDWFFDWINGKWFDTFAPVGPYVTTADELGDPHNLEFSLEVSGQVYQKGSTAQMIDDVYTLVSFFSRMMTLEPGDMIATGTPAGVGFAKGRYLKPGDVMKGSFDRLGTLINPVVDEMER